MTTTENAFLRQELDGAFPALPNAGVNLRRALEAENWGHPARGPFDGQADKWDTWKDIPVVALNFYEPAISTYWNAEFTTFFAAFLLRLITEMETGEPISHASDSLVFYMTQWRSKGYRCVLLSADQKRVVERVLEAALRHDGFRSE